MRGWMAIVTVPLVTCAGLAGCGSSDNTSPAATSTSTAGGHGGAGGVSPAGGAAGGVTVGVGGGMACGPPCSDDLKQVLDCDGQVVKTCGPDMACLNGACSDDPCAAAAASRGGHGCEFWALKPELHSSGTTLFDPCFAVLIANTWDAPVHLAVRREGTTFAETGFIRVPQGSGQNLTYAPYDPATGLAPGQLAIAFLSDYIDSSLEGKHEGCPVPPALDDLDVMTGTGRGQAFAIEADRPVGAHSIFPYGHAGYRAASASLLLPASSWGTNYLAINPYRAASPVLGTGLQILAREDGTEVTLLPKVPIQGGGGVAPAPANAPVTYALGAGEYLQLSQAFELTGSAIASNKPIGVWGETLGLFVPGPSFASGDSAHQQLPPVRALGSRYAGVRYRNRSSAVTEETPPWRLVGAVDGTKLSWKPAPPAAGLGTLDQGQVIEFWAPGPFVVESQDEEHPFYLAQYMTACGYINPDPTLCKGDPEWVNVIPTRQYLSRYVFFTEPTYAHTSLVVVRERSPTTQQFADVTLDCAGALTDWQPLDEAFEYTRVDLVTDCEPVAGCDNGRHEMTSALPFGVTVWSWNSECSTGVLADAWSSYAYPAGASLRAINDVVIRPTPE